MNSDELYGFIKQVKNAKAYGLCIRVCEYALDKFACDENFINDILPMYTSSLREMGQSQKAIEKYTYYDKFLYKKNPALLTSIAAAYLDIDDDEKALQLCDKAYAIQGGGVGFKNELSLVYKRINKIREQKGKTSLEDRYL